MKQITFVNDWKEKTYFAPSCRLLALNFEVSFLASNLEPIDDDGNEYGWD